MTEEERDNLKPGDYIVFEKAIRGMSNYNATIILEYTKSSMFKVIDIIGKWGLIKVGHPWYATDILKKEYSLYKQLNAIDVPEFFINKRK